MYRQRRRRRALKPALFHILQTVENIDKESKLRIWIQVERLAKQAVTNHRCKGEF